MARVNLESYYNTALQFHQSGKLKEARKLYAEILKLQPRHLDSLFMMAQAYYQEGNFDQAIRIIQDALMQQPKHLQLSLLQVKALMKTRKLAEARQHLDQLKSNYVNHPQVLFHSGRNYKEHGQLDLAIQAVKTLVTPGSNPLPSRAIRPASLNLSW